MTEGEASARHQLAHDLRSPIRAIAIYADLMTRELQSPTRDAETLEKCCSQIVAAAEELGTLVDHFTEQPGS